MLICYGVAVGLINPLLKTQYRYLEDPKVYYQVYGLFAVWCLLIMYLVWKPLFNIKEMPSLKGLYDVIKVAA